MLNDFKKTESQKKAIGFLSSPSKHIALSGGSRSGKSFILMFSMIVRACKIKSRHCILRLNFNAIKRSLFLETFPKVMSLCFPDLKVHINKTDHIVTFPNGSQIFFAGLDTGERVEKILGQEFSTMWFNEISQIDYSSIQIALTRLAEKNSLLKKVYYDMNPGTKSSWPYYLFVKKLNPIDNEPLKDPENYTYFKMNPADNIENIDEEYLNLLNAMPEKERNRFLNGEFNDESDGQVYYQFRREDHVRELDKGYGSLFIGQDFNVNPMTAVIFQVYDNTFEFIDEVFLENSDTYKMSAELIKKGYRGCTIFPDSTGKNRKTSGKSDFQILQEDGFVIHPTRNPFVTDRVNNFNRLLKANRILIDPKCKKLINDLEKVKWKNNDLDQSGENSMLTHISDAAGYGLWALEPINTPKKSTTVEKYR